MKSIQKRQDEVEAQGRPFYATRKREIENYLCPDLILAEAGVAVEFTDTCDAKKIIGAAVNMKADDVIDRFWPRMTADQIIRCSTYVENSVERAELKELVTRLLTLVR